jgi:pyridoxamine 5'-phosphate oxidase
MSLLDPLDEMLSRLGLPDPLPADPMPLFSQWFDEAVRKKAEPNPNAMVLATVGDDGAPSARVVLCKSIDVAGGSIVFFTNYRSRKGRELLAHPRVATVFHWDHADRQVRVEGSVTLASAEESDAYFQSRALLSRLGAWASEQSEPLASRFDLVRQTREVMKRFGVGIHHLVMPSGAPDFPRPPHWGGFRLAIRSLELWQGGGGRLHDRARWTRTDAGWSSTRLNP